MNAFLEIELKYRITDVSTVQLLLENKRIGPCTVGEFNVREIVDTYFDTSIQSLANSHYALRYRQRAGGSSVQLKSVEKAAGNVHTRRELEIATDLPTQPDAWPPGPERDFVRDILQTNKLEPLFAIQQTRHYAPLDHDGNTIAELSVDEVRWLAGESTMVAWILEIEMIEGADQSLLHAIAQDLSAYPNLLNEQRSKYEIGLSMLNQV